MATYKIVSMSRNAATRTVRALNPGHRGAVQFLAGTDRLIRGRPLVVSEEQVRKHLKELRDKQNAGMLIVTTMDDQQVSLSEERFLSVVAAPAAPIAVPIFPLDSIHQDDAPPGIPMSNLPGGLPAPTGDLDLPAPIGVQLDELPAEEVAVVEPAAQETTSADYAKSYKKNKRY